MPECQVLDSEILHQFYDRSKIMMGILPTGAIPTEPQQRLSSVFELTYATITKLLQDEQAKQAWLKQVSERLPKLQSGSKKFCITVKLSPNGYLRTTVMSS